ncbi:MAG: beta-galactosidase [Anaerolineae bacterium]|nr:beta-galactosidase [Anaerolineae bacterium]
MTDSPFTFGAVYFRKSNPPQADWARDYQTAVEDGMNTFRHWFLWSAIEVAPGRYVWDDYDRQLELGARHGIQAIVAEMIAVAPEWAYRQYAHARYETADGRRLDSTMHGSCAVGGAPGLCLDNDDVRQHAERFLRELAARYKGHPGLKGYDIWNECGYGADVCYCPATAEAFRAWLKEKYGNVRTLGEVWHRYSLASWDDVVPPRGRAPYPDTVDWLQFRIDNAYEQMRWRIDTVRSIDPDCALTAHGVASSLTSMAQCGTDDWRAAAEVESYGYTWGSSRHGDEPWKQFHAVDLVRAAARGKPFWHAEAYAGPLWMQPQVIGKRRDEGRIASPEDVRYWNLTSCMLGATGIMYLRWRPLLDGPLFGAFGPYGLDGARTPRSEMSARIARWVNDPAQARLWQSRPVRGEVGLLYVPEAQQFTYAQQGSTEFYARSMQGAYQGFFDLNVQADWVHVDDIEWYDLLYLPFPVMLTQATADRLKGWVAAGGTLVSEGCPGYWGDGVHIGPMQPNLGLDELFGVRESYVEFTPDLLGDLCFNLNGAPAWGGIFLQAYQPTTGTPVGWYADGQVAAVDHVFGKGKTRLIGTMAGAGYAAHAGTETRPPVPEVFKQVLAFGSKVQHVWSSEPLVKARLHDGSGGVYLWVANPTRRDRFVRLTLSAQWGPFAAGKSLWGNEAQVRDRIVELTAPSRDVTVIELTAAADDKSSVVYHS